MSTIDLNDSHESNLSYTSDDFEEVTHYDEAPWEVFGHIDNEKVVIAVPGDKLPKETKYKTTHQSPYARKFRYILCCFFLVLTCSLCNKDQYRPVG